MSEPIPTATARDTLPLPRFAKIALWVAIGAAGIYQLALLVTAIAGRVGYPYDLEWMEGGMLHHALRIRSGEGIYVPPSVDFIPYLYTPLYPTMLALFGGAFGLTYKLGRMFSVVALVGIGVVIVKSIADRRHQHRDAGPAYAGAALAIGLFAAAYPYVDGWYDLVRADTFFLFMVTAAIAGLSRWTVNTRGWQLQAKVAAGAAILALAFFCKQTAIFYVGIGGAVVLVLAWRAVPIFIAVAAAIGLGGTALLNASTDGWFWTYVSKIHRAHDFNMDRFWKSFGNILWHFPAMTIAIGVVLVAVVATWIRDRRFPPQAFPFVLWTGTFAVSTVAGAIGWGTEFAHFNAYIPAFLHGALAAGAAVPAMAACAHRFIETRDASPRTIYLTRTLGAVAIAIPLALTLGFATWSPGHFIPSAASVGAGDRLIDQIRKIDGDVWVPAHPWYAYLAGKSPHVHRMGIKDVTAREPRPVGRLYEAVRDHAFAAIVVDKNLETGGELSELPPLRPAYHPVIKLSREEKPGVVSGVKVMPDAIWFPSVDSRPPAGVKAVFDFEATSWGAWKRSGAAWGPGPVEAALPGQDFVVGATGQRFATSMHDGDVGVGRVTSPEFTLDGSKLTLRLGGGTDATKLRAELWVDDAIVRTASVPPPGGDNLKTVTLDISELRGKQATLVLVDDATVIGGHLDIDDVWLWP